MSTLSFPAPRLAVVDDAEGVVEVEPLERPAVGLATLHASDAVERGRVTVDHQIVEALVVVDHRGT